MRSSRAPATDPLGHLVSARAAASLRAFRREAGEALPGRVAGVLLFGSRARGDARRTSDYDVAVLVRGPLDEGRANDAITDAAYRHILAGIHIRPVVLPADALDDARPGSLADMVARDGIAIP